MIGIIYEHKNKINGKRYVGQVGINLGKTWKNSNEYKERHSKIMKESYKKSGRKSALYGKHWYTNGSKNVVGYVCPEGFYPGKVQKA